MGPLAYPVIRAPRVTGSREAWASRLVAISTPGAGPAEADAELGTLLRAREEPAAAGRDLEPAHSLDNGSAGFRFPGL